MKSILNWLDDRTGYKELLNEALYERIPGGARWRYVWGSTLVFTFMVQMVTGIFLWMAYSPSSQTAWESVYYIQHDMQFGWLLRGVHHFTAQAMIVLLALHLMQVIIDGAYKAPREVNFWLGLILLKIVLGLSLTGYLLPWDQKGFWATQVATKLAAIVPVVGPDIQRLVVGGPDYGHHTLTRFFAMHAGLLPALLIAFLGLHIYVFRRHGITVHGATRKPDTTFWPDQVLRDAVACFAVLAVVLGLVGWGAYGMSAAELTQLNEQGELGRHLGAHLGAPADPSDAYSAARPEWYFLFLFQFLKYFPGETEIWGAIVIPGIVFGVMFLMPFIGRWKVGHAFNVAYIFILMAGAGFLTYQALSDDNSNKTYQRAVANADENAHRVVELIEGNHGIGHEPARVMLRNDPKTQGPKIFAAHCSQCHRFDGHDGLGVVSADAATAAELGDFGGREWLKGFLTNPADPKYFGATANGKYNGEPIGDRFTAGEMADWSSSNIPSMSKREIDGVVEFLISQSGRTDILPADPDLVEIGKEFFVNGSENASACADCHAMRIGDEEIAEGSGVGYPDLTGYASEEWLRSFINNPGADHNYGPDGNAMPAFAKRVSERELDLLVNWLQRRWYQPAEK